MCVCQWSEAARDLQGQNGVKTEVWLTELCELGATIWVKCCSNEPQTGGHWQMCLWETSIVFSDGLLWLAGGKAEQENPQPLENKSPVCLQKKVDYSWNGSAQLDQIVKIKQRLSAGHVRSTIHKYGRFRLLKDGFVKPGGCVWINCIVFKGAGGTAPSWMEKAVGHMTPPPPPPVYI